MAAAAAAVGWAMMGLSVLPLADYYFPPAIKANSVIRIGIGQSQNYGAPAQADGTEPNIALFGVNGKRIGWRQGHGKVGEGKTHDITVTPFDSKDTTPPAYLSVSASSSNAICIAYIYVTGPNEERFGIYGDTAYQCGHPWYPSILPAGSDSDYRPKCAWIEQPDKDDLGDYLEPQGGSKWFPMGFTINMMDFISASNDSGSSRAAQYEEYPDTLCKSDPRFKMWPSLTELNCPPAFRKLIEKDTGSGVDVDLTAATDSSNWFYACDPKPGERPSIRQKHQLGRWTGGRFPKYTYGNYHKRGTTLDATGIRSSVQDCSPGKRHIVISDSPAHSAVEVCESPGATGPDFASTHERKMCDLCARRLLPFCESPADDDCFDPGNSEIRPAARSGTAAKRGLEVEDEPDVPVYDSTTTWSSTKRWDEAAGMHVHEPVVKRRWHY